MLKDQAKIFDFLKGKEERNWLLYNEGGVI